MNTIVKESFMHTKKFVWVGAFEFLFYFCAIYTFFSAFIPLMEKQSDGKLSQMFHLSFKKYEYPEPANANAEPEPIPDQAELMAEKTTFKVHFFHFLLPLACLVYNKVMSIAYKK